MHCRFVNFLIYEILFCSNTPCLCFAGVTFTYQCCTQGCWYIISLIQVGCKPVSIRIFLICVSGSVMEQLIYRKVTGAVCCQDSKTHLHVKEYCYLIIVKSCLVIESCTVYIAVTFVRVLCFFRSGISRENKYPLHYRDTHIVYLTYYFLRNVN